MSCPSPCPAPAAVASDCSRPSPDRPRVGAALAVVAAFVAFGARVALDPVLPLESPYLTFFPAVILKTFVCGLRPEIVCAVLCGLAAWYCSLPSAGSFELNGQTALALAFYAFITIVDIGLIHTMHVADDRLRAAQHTTARLFKKQRTLFQKLRHRVANAMQFVAALVTPRNRCIASDPQATITAPDDAPVRSETISRIHRRLYDPSRLSLPVGDYLQELRADMLDATGTRDVVCVVDVDAVAFDLTSLTTLSLLVVELVTNALEHAFPPGAPGTIAIRPKRLDAGHLRLTIADEGRGLPHGFDAETSRSLGWRILKGLAAQLGGTLRFDETSATVARLNFAQTPSIGTSHPIGFM